MTADQQAEVGRRLQAELAQGFRFSGVQQFSLGQRSHSIALFSADEESMFALIPGGEIEIGFDASRWEPSAEELQSWTDTVEEYGIETTLSEHLDAATTTRRTVTTPPLLVETKATELGWSLIDLDDPDAKELLDGFPAGSAPFTARSSRGHRQTRVSRDASGRITAEAADSDLTHQSLNQAMRARGFRYPTSDEWEFLCGAGSTSLFRWGDHAPCDRYPTDVSPAEAAWRREWVLSGGQLDYPAEGFESDWDYHRRPNALGMIIAENPYHCELVADADTLRGGDGGCTICGGAGFFVGWLTLASAYFEEHACRVDPDIGISVGYTFGRRVLPLN